MSYEKKTEIIPSYEVDTTKVRGPFDLPHSGRVPSPIREVGVNRVVGRTVLSGCCHLGSYGMGGPGFVGLELDKTGERSVEWLVLTLWAADEWLHYDGKPIYAMNKTFDSYGQKKFIESVKSKVVKSFDIADKSCKIVLDDIALEFKQDPIERPTYGGTGGYRTLMENDSLLDAWVVASQMYLGI